MESEKVGPAGYTSESLRMLETEEGQNNAVFACCREEPSVAGELDGEHGLGMSGKRVAEQARVSRIAEVVQSCRTVAARDSQCATVGADGDVEDAAVAVRELRDSCGRAPWVGDVPQSYGGVLAA